MLLLCALFQQYLNAQVNANQMIESGRAALNYGDQQTAIQYFNIALETKPYLSEAYYGRALAEFDLGQYAEAEADLDQAIKFNPFHVEYFQLRGLCRIHNERYAGAVFDYTRVVEERPEDRDCFFNRALCLFEIQDYVRASDELTQIIRRWPRFARAYVVKAQTCMELGDTLQGIFWVDSLLVLSKKEPNAWSVKGRYALQHQDYQKADSCFSMALRYDAGNNAYYLLRAQARYALQQYSRAKTDLDRVIGMHPDHFVAHYNRALTHIMLRDEQQALADVDFVLRADSTIAPRPSLAYLRKQQPQGVRKRGDGQLHLFNMLIEDDDKPLSFMEEFKVKVQDHKAERVFLPMFRAEGNHLHVEGGRHPIYSSDEAFLAFVEQINVDNGVSVQSALALLRQYLDVHFDDSILLYDLGCLEAEDGNFEAAEQAFARAIELDPLMPEAYYNKAVIHLLQNDNKLAIPLFVKAGEMGVVKAYTLLHQIETK